MPCLCMHACTHGMSCIRPMSPFCIRCIFFLCNLTVIGGGGFGFSDRSDGSGELSPFFSHILLHFSPPRHLQKSKCFQWFQPQELHLKQRVFSRREGSDLRASPTAAPSNQLQKNFNIFSKKLNLGINKRCSLCYTHSRKLGRAFKESLFFFRKSQPQNTHTFRDVKEDYGRHCKIQR